VVDELTKLKLKHLINELKNYRARHTELVSVYIPQGYDLQKMVDMLEKEYHTAQNIQSKTTRKNVMTALEKMLNALKQYKQTPPNGLAIFSGNVGGEGKEDFRVFVIEPPNPIKSRIYRCDQRFVVDPLEDLLENQDSYGLLVIDKQEATIGLLKGKSIKILKKIDSFVPGKFKAGGQSANRFARIREELKKMFFNKVAEEMAEKFRGENIKGILVGGPFPTKEEFVNGNYLPTDIKNKILALIDLSYTDESGLEELVNKAEDVIKNSEVAEEKRIVKEFFKKLATDPDFVVYGLADTKKALELGAVDTLLISEDKDEKIMNELIELAKMFGTDVKIISKETQEGVQFANLGGIGGILRYKLEQ
jgi:peptide chain release factor subunit 1